MQVETMSHASVLTCHEMPELPSYNESSSARILRNLSGFMDPTPGS